MKVHSARSLNVDQSVHFPDMDERQFKQWVALLSERTGTVLRPERKSFLVTNLGIRMREIGCDSYSDYYDHIQEGGMASWQEWQTLVDRLTVHETRFFRHPDSLKIVRQLVREKAPNAKGKVSIQAWSTACATGEEAYTLAMVIDESLQRRTEGGFFGVLASDISQASLQTARRAVYPERRIKQVSAPLRRTYFEQVAANRYQVCEELRKRVCFARMNVLEMEQHPVGEMDLIYCQNLLIYFERDLREEIVNRMAERLAPGGILVLGSGELVSWNNPELEKLSCRQTLAFRRKPESGQGS